jgi:hypothetical protein
MRLKTIFVRADVLLKKLPALKDRIGPEYPDLEQTLICIQEHKDPTRIKVTDLMTDIKTSLKPLTPIWNKFKKARKPSKQRP